jgi:hypothetical protein
MNWWVNSTYMKLINQIDQEELYIYRRSEKTKEKNDEKGSNTWGQ